MNEPVCGPTRRGFLGASALGAAALVAAWGGAAGTIRVARAAVLPGAATEPDRAPTVLGVDVARPFKRVDHAASGALYGLGEQGWPPDEWIAGIEPKMFTQPPPGARQVPNGEPAPVGDMLDTWRMADRAGAAVTIRLPDIFPTFPYQWQGDDYWYAQVERMVREARESGAGNVYGYEIWNEPQWTWNPAWGSYFDMWQRTYRMIRELDPDGRIVGPSYDRDYENGLREFFTFAVGSGTVPDVVSWHELGPEEGLHVGEHVSFYRDLEQQLGIEPRPISINEYASPRDAGVPGWLTRFVAKLERAEVDTADLAFWHKPGRLSDLLVPVGGGSGPARDAQPTGNYWLFGWYADMSGQMVETVPPAESGRFVEVGDPHPAPATRSPGQDGFGNSIGLNGPEPNEYVQLPAGIVSGLDDFTVAAWVKPAATTTWSRVFDFGSGQEANMFLTVNAGSGPRFAITTGGGGAEQRIDAGSGQLAVGEWSHVAVTKSGDAGTLWVNGEPAGTNSAMTLRPADLGDTGQNWIGRSQYPDPLLDATVDEFQVYDRGLGRDEIRSLLQAPAGSAGGGDVVWYRFDEEGGPTAVDASGNGRDGNVVTAVTGVELVPALEGFASADHHTRTVRVVFGGGEGDIRLDVTGLHALHGFGGKANVQVFTTEWTGTDGVSAGAVALFEGTYHVRHGALSVPVAGTVDTDAYLAVIRPAHRAPPFCGPVHRYEAEDAVSGHDHRSWSEASSPLASGNSYVKPKRREGGRLTFTVDATVAGAHDLRIRYANTGSTVVDTSITVNGRDRGSAGLRPTGAAALFTTNSTHVVLAEGRNRITLGVTSTTVGLDYVEATPYRARFQAENGTVTGAQVVHVDMSTSNFGANYLSGNAYVRGIGGPDSWLELPVTVPAAGTYELTIGYSTGGTQQERRAQVPAKQVLRVNDGAWRQVTYEPTQFREMIRQTRVAVVLPAGTSTLTLASGHPDHPGETQPGTVDLDYVDVRLHPA